MTLDAHLPDSDALRNRDVERRLRILENASRDAIDPVGGVATIALATLAFGGQEVSVSSFESTSSASATDLATVGPVASVVVGTSGKLLVFGSAAQSCVSDPAGSGGVIWATLTGTATASAVLAQCLAPVNTAMTFQGTGFALFTGLTPGPYTVTMQYAAVTAAVVFFSSRSLLVQPY